MISDDDVAKIVQALEARGCSVHKKDAPPNKVLLEEKYFRRIEKYGGKLGSGRSGCSASAWRCLV